MELNRFFRQLDGRGARLRFEQSLKGALTFLAIRGYISTIRKKDLREGRWFVAQFDWSSGDLVTAFVPNSGQVGSMLKLLGK